jgi:rhodanese-related sulfurtransferase
MSRNDRQTIGRWSASDLRDRRARGEEIVVIDVRNGHARAFDPCEIPGTDWMPLSEIAEHGHRLSRSAEIVTYCT